MGGFNRGKFAATPLNNLQEQKAHQEEATNIKGDRIDFKKLTPGKNRIRLFPAHPGTPSFMYPRTVHFLPIEVREYDKDKKEYTDKKVVKQKPIFSAKVHLNPQNGELAKCPTDQYLTRAIQWCHDNIQDEKARKDKLSLLIGQKGIKGQTKWIAYANIHKGDVKTFCKIELATTVQVAINNLAAGQDDDSGVIVTDPFSDPDTGRLLIVTYDDKATKPGDYYSTTIDLNKSTPLTDSELEELSKQPSLESLFVNSFRKKDYDFMIEGLKRFDEEHGFGVFQDPEYQQVLKEISQYEFAPDEDEEVTENDSTDSTDTSDLKDDLPFDIPLKDMDRDDLVGYVRRNNLEIRVLPRYTKEDLVQFIQEEEEIQKQNDQAQQEQEAEDKQEDQELSTSPRSSRRSSRLSS